MKTRAKQYTMVLLLLLSFAGCTFEWERVPQPEAEELTAGEPAESLPEPEALEEAEPEEPEEELPAEFELEPLFNGKITDIMFVSENLVLLHRTWHPQKFAGFYLYDLELHKLTAEVELQEAEYSYIGEESVAVVTQSTLYEWNLQTLEPLGEWPVLFDDYSYNRLYSEDREWFAVPGAMTFVNNGSGAPTSYGEVAELRRTALHGWIAPGVMAYRTSIGEWGSWGGTQFFTGICSIDGSINLQYALDNYIYVRRGRAVLARPFEDDPEMAEAFSETIYLVESPDYTEVIPTEIPNMGGFRMGVDGQVIGNAIWNKEEEIMTLKSYRFDTRELLLEAELPVAVAIDENAFAVSPDGRRFAFTTWNNNGYEDAFLCFYTIPDA